MESYEKQEIPRAFRGRATGKEENQPRTPGNLQHEARERGKAVSCLRSEESHSTRTTFRAPSLKRKASQRAVVDPTEDHSPLLPRGGQEEEKRTTRPFPENHLLCVRLQKQSRDQRSSPPGSRPPRPSFVKQRSEIRAGMGCSSSWPNTNGKEGGVRRRKNAQASLVPQNVSPAASLLRAVLRPPPHPQDCMQLCEVHKEPA